MLRAACGRQPAAMPDYRRHRIPGGTYFFTVNLADRRSTLLVQRVDALRAAFDATRKVRPFRMTAYVVLPDHLHCLWTLPAGDADYATRWSQIKAEFSRAVAHGERVCRSRARRRERGIWQRRYWEHCIRDEDDLHRHLDYIHFNPVKHGHAPCVVDWPHSSFQAYVQKGLYPLDWSIANS